jgi:hypothetical protein
VTFQKEKQNTFGFVFSAMDSTQIRVMELPEQPQDLLRTFWGFSLKLQNFRNLCSVNLNLTLIFCHNFRSSLPLQFSATIYEAVALVDYDGGLDWAELGVLK